MATAKQRKWEYLLLIHNKECFWCRSTHNLTLDHIVPKAAGGSNYIENYIIACRFCNERRGDMPFHLYRRIYAPNVDYTHLSICYPAQHKYLYKET